MCRAWKVTDEPSDLAVSFCTNQWPNARAEFVVPCAASAQVIAEVWVEVADPFSATVNVRSEDDGPGMAGAFRPRARFGFPVGGSRKLFSPGFSTRLRWVAPMDNADS